MTKRGAGQAKASTEHGITVLHPESWTKALGSPPGVRLVAWESAQRHGTDVVPQLSDAVCLPLITNCMSGARHLEFHGAILDAAWTGGTVVVLVPQTQDPNEADTLGSWDETAAFVESVFGHEFRLHADYDAMTLNPDLPKPLWDYLVRTQPRFYAEQREQWIEHRSHFLRTLAGCPVMMMAARWGLDGDRSADASQWGDGVVAFLPGSSEPPTEQSITQLVELLRLLKDWGARALHMTLTKAPWIRLPPGATPVDKLDGDLRSVVLALLRSKRRNPHAYIDIAPYMKAKGKPSALIARLREGHGYRNVVSARSERMEWKKSAVGLAVPAEARGYRIRDDDEMLREAKTRKQGYRPESPTDLPF